LRAFIRSSLLLVYLLIFMLALQLGFWLLIADRLHSYLPVTSTSAVRVSVIVCAHDEESNLRELVPQLLQQEHPAFEVVIVNDRSNDGTYDFLLEASREHAMLRMVHVTTVPDHVNAKKYAVTLGIKAAKYECVLLTDADCRPAGPRWLATMAAGLGDDTSIVLGYSGYRSLGGWLNAFIRFETQLTGLLYCGLALAGVPYMGVGRNLLYARSLFLDNKGFDRQRNVTGGDDDLFVNRVASAENTQVVLSPDALVISTPKTSWSGFFRQKVRHLAAGKRYRFGHKLVLGAWSVSYMGFWALVVAGSLHAGWAWIATAVIIRWALMIYAGHLFALRTGDRLETAKWPVLDILYAFYYLTVGLVALVTKRIRWR
jgi:cellulose synthase/poly-beta-1,6-N-acetylglucosamine synthase-like glycosyltransferase